ncbi:ABC transporter permease subunit [Fervidibacillus halotolerans]|uniref:ABC transporter permease subunit n=1 Tax=Fervidibacillus halotolerans TaxID=2980027 RepID=A0A9E8LZQ9_9BACI|nr:ABC transporter permease subunit [Fervidibacillus halotolerans]WAA12803.1 ABC transporter permease subunit [Fervidibacillus halotolerans]
MKFELKKSWRSRKIFLLFLFTLIFVSGLFFRNFLMQEEIKERKLQQLSPLAKEVHEISSEYTKKLFDNPENTTFQAINDHLIEMQTKLQDLTNAIKYEDWESVPLFELQFLESIQNYQILGGEFKTLQGLELEKAIEKNKILVHNNLPYEDDQYSLSTPNFIKLISTTFMSLLGIVFFIFIIGDLFVEDLEGQTIRTIYTQPIKKWKVILSKYITMLITSVIAVFFIFIISFLCTLLVNGQVGSFQYPQLIEYGNLHELGFTYISTGEYLFQWCILFLCVVSFSFAIVILVSVILSNRIGVLFTSVLLILSGVFITNHFDVLQNHLNPFYYYNLREWIERPKELSQLKNVWILFLYSVLIFFVCLFLQKRTALLNKQSVSKRPFRKGNTIRSAKGFKAIFLFEFRKHIRQGYIKPMIFVITIFIIVAYIFISLEVAERKKEMISSTKTNIEFKEDELISTYENKLEEYAETIRILESKKTLTEDEKLELQTAKDRSVFYEEQLEIEKTLLQQMKDMLQAYEEEYWRTYYDYWIYQNKLWKGEIILQDRTYVSQLSFFTYAASIEEKEILKRKGLEPVLPSDTLYTIYDYAYETNPVKRLERINESRKIDNTGLFYVYTFISTFAYFVPIFLLLFLFGTGFSKEKGKKRPLHFLYTQPVSKGRIYTAKYIVSIVLSISFFLGIIFFMTIIGTIGNRFGDWEFPILHYDAEVDVKSASYSGTVTSEGGFHFINMGDYLVENVLLIITGLIFLIALALFLSNFVKNYVHLIVLTTVISIAGYFVSTMDKFSHFTHLLPFTYLNSGKIINGEIATVLNNNAIGLSSGVIVLLFSTLILYLIGVFIFKKQTRI